jgi:5''-nucleotidase/2'',3''-cyclic phosphodiesterase and related esterases
MRHALLLAALAAAAAAPAAAEFRLTILHTNDVHSRIQPINRFDSTCSAEDDAAGECFGGVARIKSALDARRAALDAAGEAHLTLDAGDQFQGSLFYTTYKGQAAAQFVNALGYQAMAVGNHEFDDGPEALSIFLDATRLPVLSGNVDASGDELLADRIPGYTVLEAGGERIAVVSVVAEDTDLTSSPGPTIAFTDPVAYLQGVVPEIEAQGIDKIIALTHVGLPVDRRIALQT